ncbi:25879_t:CDS:2, partial [Racocetra persica]
PEGNVAVNHEEQYINDKDGKESQIRWPVFIKMFLQYFVAIIITKCGDLRPQDNLLLWSPNLSQ